jgi:hypothetical protein
MGGTAIGKKIALTSREQADSTPLPATKMPLYGAGCAL